MKLSFTKMQGCANDYIYLDCRKSGVPENIAALPEKLSRRHFSIGGRHHLHLHCADSGWDGMMRIFNADGSEGRMCGNGIRCVAEWLYTHGIAKEILAIDTLSGLKTVTHKGAGPWQVGDGRLQCHARQPACCEHGRRTACGQRTDRGRQNVACDLHQCGQPHCVTVVEGCGQPEAGRDRSGL